MTETTPQQKAMRGEHGKDYVYCDLCGAPIPFAAGTVHYLLQTCRVSTEGIHMEGMNEYLCGGCVLDIHGGSEPVQY